MKKMILILILIIPVLIAMVSYLIAGFVGREITIYAVSNVSIPPEREEEMYDAFTARGMDIFYDSERHSRWIIDQMYVGEEMDMKPFLEIAPSRAKFSDINVSYMRNGFTAGNNDETDSGVIFENGVFIARWPDSEVEIVIQDPDTKALIAFNIQTVREG